MSEQPKSLGPRIGQVKASQIRGAPDYPTQNLYPCSMQPSEYVFWALNGLGLSEGIICRDNGWISFAPAMVSRMAIQTFSVWTCVDAFDEGASYKLTLMYTAKDGKHYSQVSAELSADVLDKFMFEIPLEHVDTEGWFVCALHFELLSPLEDINEVATGHADGLDNPCKPLLIKGTYLEIKG